jgi:hypothetical protein
MEWLQDPDDAARFALLWGKQVNMVVNIPYAIAKDLPRSESGTRGVNPHKGPLWTQTEFAKHRSAAAPQSLRQPSLTAAAFLGDHASRIAKIPTRHLVATLDSWCGDQLAGDGQQSRR